MTKFDSPFLYSERTMEMTTWYNKHSQKKKMIGMSFPDLSLSPKKCFPSEFWVFSVWPAPCDAVECGEVLGEMD